VWNQDVTKFFDPEEHYQTHGITNEPRKTPQAQNSGRQKRPFLQSDRRISPRLNQILIPDTNIWLEELEWIDRIINDVNYKVFLILVPVTVCHEIEQKQQDSNVGHLAREAFRQMEAFLKKFPHRIMRQSMTDYDKSEKLFNNRGNNDLKIKQAAILMKNNGFQVKIFTRDKGFRIACYADDPKVDLFNPISEEWNLKVEEGIEKSKN